MEFILTAVIGCVVFALCFAALLLKGRKEDAPARLHTCGRDDACQCRKHTSA